MINIMQYRLIGSTPICRGERKSMRESRLTSDFSAADAVAAVKARGGDPKKINPMVPVDLIVDHSVQVYFFGTGNSLESWVPYPAD